MSFVEGLNEIVGREGLAPLIGAGLNEGLSGASMLSSLREVGMGIRTQSFYQLVGEIQAAQGSVERWADLAQDAIPQATDFVEWSGGAADTYLYRVKYAVRTGEGGELSVQTKVFNVQSREAISPADATDQAMQQLDDNADSDNYNNQTVLGPVGVGLYHQIGF